MSDLIQNKLNSVVGDVARPTKFKCAIFPPSTVKFNISLNGGDASPKDVSSNQAAEYLDYFCFSSSFPGVSADTLDFKYKGRNIPIKSVQNYEQTWTATFYNDERHAVRKLFIDWVLLGQRHQYTTNLSTEKNEEFPSISIYQLDYELTKDMVIYSMMNVYPRNVGNVEVSYDNLNQVETFTVEFSFSHFEIIQVEGNGLTSSEISSLIQSTIQNTLNGIRNSALGFLGAKANDLIASNSSKESESFDNFLG